MAARRRGRIRCARRARRTAAARSSRSARSVRNPMARIAVDAMGGDRAPEEIVAGALEAASPQITPVLVGPSGLNTGGLELIEAQTTIAMDEKPADAVRGKRDSSLVVACRLLPGGRAHRAGFPRETRAHAAPGVGRGS